MASTNALCLIAALAILGVVYGCDECVCEYLTGSTSEYVHPTTSPLCGVMVITALPCNLIRLLNRFSLLRKHRSIHQQQLLRKR